MHSASSQAGTCGIRSCSSSADERATFRTLAWPMVPCSRHRWIHQGKAITPDDSLRHMASSEKGILHRDAFSYANFQERKPQAQRDWQEIL